MINSLSLRARVLIAAAGAVLLVAAALVYVVLTRGAAGVTPTSDGAIVEGPRMLVVSDRKLATVSAVDLASPRVIHDVDCVRSYTAGDTTVCLHPKDAWTHTLVVMNRHFEDPHEYPLPGVPSRARVSDSGRMVSWTSFTDGDSYTTSGMSTRTGVIDTKTGEYVPSIEHFSVTLDGKPYRAADVNYWGISFADDDNTFYASLATGGERYLVRGDFKAETVETLATNVECPSISPDGTRLAFKQAIDNDPLQGWRISVLELSTMKVTNLSETRSIDDQPAWLDDQTVAYTFRAADGVPSVWSVPADGTGTPTKLADDAESPAPLP